MGRQEKPIREGCEQESLALWLRAQRQRARLTCAELAQKTGHAPRTLRNAASGESLPKLQLLLDVTRVCGVDDTETNRQWQRALQRHNRQQGVDTVPLPQYIGNFADLLAAMIDVRARAGNPSLRRLEERAGAGKLPRSTLAEVLNGRAALRLEILVAFLRACGVPEGEISVWQGAWRIAQARTVSPRSHTPKRGEGARDTTQWFRTSAQRQTRDGRTSQAVYMCPVCTAMHHTRKHDHPLKQTLRDRYDHDPYGSLMLRQALGQDIKLADVLFKIDKQT